MSTNRLLWSFALPLAVIMAACNTVDDDADLNGDDTAEMPAPAPATPPVEPVVTDLDEVDDSNISGEATATHGPSEVTVSILLKEGANPQTSYPAHIHTGTCEKGGPIAVELSPVTNLQSTKTVPLSALPANQDAFVQVHDESGKAIACGDLKGHGADNRVGTDTTVRTPTGY